MFSIVIVTAYDDKKPEEIMDKVFKPYYQADNSFSRQHGGMGLGLYLADKLVIFMRGDIGFNQDESGETVFRYTVIMDKIS